MSADVILTKDKRIDYTLANAFPFKFFFNEKKVEKFLMITHILIIL